MPKVNKKRERKNSLSKKSSSSSLPPSKKTKGSTSHINSHTNSNTNNTNNSSDSIETFGNIYRDSKAKRTYYESCHNIPIPFSIYVPSKRKQSTDITTTTATTTTISKNNTTTTPTINVTIGDVLIVQVDSQNTASPLKKFLHGNKNQIWYPFTVPWATCEVLAIYKKHDNSNNNKHYQQQQKHQQCYFIVRYFNRTNETSLKEIEKIHDNQVQPYYNNNNNNNNNDDSIKYSIEDLKHIEEVYETDFVSEILPLSILGKAYVILPGGLNIINDMTSFHHRQDHDHHEGDELNQRMIENNNGVIYIRQYSKTCLLLNTKREYSLISQYTGKCHFDNELDTFITQYIQKKIKDIRGCTGVDLFWLFRYCRGIQCFLNHHKRGRVNNNLIECCLKFAFERAKVRQEDIHSDDDESNFGSEEIARNKTNEDSDSDEEIVHDDIHVEFDLNEDDNGKIYESPEKTITDGIMHPTPCSQGSFSDNKGWVYKLPFHVDVAALKAFYSEINIKVPFDSYMEPYNNNRNDENSEWKISIGDTVAIHVEESKKNSRAISTTFPFEVSWWPGEIVAIYSNIDCRDEALELREKTIDANKQIHEKKTDQFHIEIRWFYRKSNIPGTAKLKMSTEAPNGMEEVFETDTVDEIDVSSLLGSISLFSDPREKRNNITLRSGIPIVNFFCHQLWSVQRKSLMPIGASDKRIERAMLYSKYMGRDSATRSAHGNLKLGNSNKVNEQEQNYGWKQRFHDTFSKLTLAESSVIGNKNEHHIIGREREREQISQFLKSAIQAANGRDIINVMNSNMFVLFIGGAPGTGKTASVKSIVYHFNQEKAEGKIPAFQFVSVNGMEMRHPFDVYVRLWEAVSDRKEICSADEALAKLDLYFGGNQAMNNKDGTKVKKRKVVVVLVDEIDYLVTKKQTVLYNLFDWPSRGFSAQSPAQVIVIGISNTLNLPERLHVRLQSRIGSERCMYASYGIDESIQILRGKLGITGNESIFHQDAIMFAARKIASESGDIRKVFHLCKAAAENVYNDLISNKRKLLMKPQPYLGIVNTADIQKASRKMFHSTVQQGIADATNMEALLFISLASLKRQLARERGGFDIKEVVTKMEGIASAFGDRKYIPSPTCSELLRMLDRLGEATVISLQTVNTSQIDSYRVNGGAFHTMISLKVDSYEVLSALKDTRHQKLAEKHLSDY